MPHKGSPIGCGSSGNRACQSDHVVSALERNFIRPHDISSYLERAAKGNTAIACVNTPDKVCGAWIFTECTSTSISRQATIPSSFELRWWWEKWPVFGIDVSQNLICNDSGGAEQHISADKPRSGFDLIHCDSLLSLVIPVHGQGISIAQADTGAK